jgi:hypothetical protein
MPLAALVMAVVLAAAPVDRDTVAKARELYNQGDYAAAIALAATATSDPAQADAAALVIARSHLERYRDGENPDDLTQGRTALRAIDPGHLSARDRREFLVGLGVSQFFDGHVGSAAELFESAFNADGSASDERLLDWWATALDRLAQHSESKDPTYERILTRMEEDLRRVPSSTVAPYWIVVALRNLGEFDRAWDAAEAGWLRASLGGLNANHLRSELDRFVTEVLIPERAAHSASTGAPITEASMRDEWTALRTEWSGRSGAKGSDGR